MSTVYNVITRYKIDASQARSEGQALKGMLGELGHSIRSSVLSFQTLLTGGLLGAGLTQATRGLVDLNSGLEQAEISIATLLSVNQVYTFNDALLAGRDIFRGLRDDAAHGVGELQDYLESYQQILNPSIQAGATLSQIREFNALLVAAGTALRGKEGAQLAGFDVQQALTVGAGQRTTPIINQALQAQGMGIEKFNALPINARFTAMLEALKAFGPAVDRQASSWEGVYSTFRDGLKEMAASASQPIFARWTADLSKLNDWLGQNEERIEHIENTVGSTLVAAWDQAIVVVRNWRAELQAVIPVLSTIAVLQMASNANLVGLNGAAFGSLGAAGQRTLGVGEGALNMAGSALGAVNRTSDKVVADTFQGLAAWFAPNVPAARAPAAVARVAAGGMGIADDFGAVFAGGLKGGAFSGVGGVMAEVGGGLRGMVSVLNPLANVIGKVALPITLLSAGFSAFVADTFGAASFLKEQGMGLIEELKVTLGAVIDIFNNGLVRTLGAGLLAAGSAAMWAIKWVIKGINAVLVPIATGFQALGIVLERGIMFVQEVIKTRSFEKAINNFWAGVATDLAGLEKKQAGRFKVGAGDAGSGESAPQPTTPKTNPVPRSVVNIGKVEVRQTIEQNAHPDRVAWAWTDMLKQVSQHPQQARIAPLPMGA